MKFLQKFKNTISIDSRFKIKEIFFKVLDFLGLNEFFRQLSKSKFTILLYHGINNHKNFGDRYQVSKQILLTHLNYLRKKKYKFITISEWINIVKEKKKIKKGYLTLTFDDGYKNVITNAYPLMKKYTAKGCLFLIPNFIGREHLERGSFLQVFITNYKKTKLILSYKNDEIEYPLISEKDKFLAAMDIRKKLISLSDDEREFHFTQFKDKHKFNLRDLYKDYIFTNWEEIISLGKNILEIGSHSLNHKNLGNIYSEEVTHEQLFKSKAKIEKKLNYSIRHLSYPNGAYNNFIIREAIKYGYESGLTTTNGFNNINTNLFKLKRIFAYNSFPLFKANLSGLYLILRKLWKLIVKKA